MFLSTLWIGNSSALNWAKEGHTQADTEGQTHSKARHSVAGHEFICSFLQDLPKVPSHYCRYTTSNQYLEPVFQSMAHLYAVYSRAAAEKNVTPLSRQVFTDEFKHLNLGLSHHKRTSAASVVLSRPATFLMTCGSTTSFGPRRKSCLTKARPTTISWYVSYMNLQALLLYSKLRASALYYKTKFAVHNFTVYNMLTHSATCYVCREGEGSLSASEFASCIVAVQVNFTFLFQVWLSDWKRRSGQGISCYQVFAWDMDNVEIESEQLESESDNPQREVIQCSGLQECYDWLALSTHHKKQRSVLSRRCVIIECLCNCKLGNDGWCSVSLLIEWTDTPSK